MAALTQQERIAGAEAWYTDTHFMYLEMVPYEQNTPEGNEIPAWTGLPGATVPVPGCIFGGGTADFNNILTHPYRRPHVGTASHNAGVSLNQAMAARACDEFDALPCYYDNGVTWGAKKLLVQEHIWWIAGQIPTVKTFQNRTVNGKNGSKMKTTIPCYLATCFAVAISTFAYGPTTATIRNETLHSLGNPHRNPNLRHGGPQFLHNRDIHCCFVLPLLFFAREVMSMTHEYFNWGPVLSIKKVLEKTIGNKVFDDYREKLKHGVWSEAWMEQQEGRGASSQVNKKSCKGMYYPYARFLQLFDHEFGFSADKGFMTADELQHLRDPISVTMTHV
jgi:hypothetical protein